ncbi:MAG: histidine phosphatase family protein [Alphaproteobacteria bacterium]
MIYFVRHGQTDWNVERRTQGQLDIPLNETGKKEAMECGKKLNSVKIDRIIASDLSRAKETANIINGFLSLPISYDSRLRELNFGDLQGVVVKDISNESWDLLNHNPHKIHAESLAEVYKRVKSFFDELDTKENTLIVTHGGVIRMAMYLANHPNSFNQEEFEKTCLEFKIKNTEIFKWMYGQTFQSFS